MSTDAPWIALASDWTESPIFDGLDAPMHPGHAIADSVRLAWVLLLCEAKTRSKTGRLRVRPSAFAKRHGLTGGPEAVEIMLEEAERDHAIRRDGDVVELVNWPVYQDGSKSANVARWLQDHLADGPKKAADVFRVAARAGIAKRTLERAKMELRVESEKRQDAWYWSLTARTPRAPSDGGLGKDAKDAKSALTSTSTSTHHRVKIKRESNDSGRKRARATPPDDPPESDSLRGDRACGACSEPEPVVGRIAPGSAPTLETSANERTTRMLRAAQKLLASPVSGQRRAEVARALQSLPDPLATLTAVLERAESPAGAPTRRGGYIATAILREAADNAKRAPPAQASG